MKKCHECDFASQGDRRELSGKLFYLDRGELESAANLELRRSTIRERRGGGRGRGVGRYSRAARVPREAERKT